MRRKIKDLPEWQPDCCSSCELSFDVDSWEGDYTLSGEFAWICPKCGSAAYPPILATAEKDY